MKPLFTSTLSSLLVSPPSGPNAILIVSQIVLSFNTSFILFTLSLSSEQARRTRVTEVSDIIKVDTIDKIDGVNIVCSLDKDNVKRIHKRHHEYKCT